MASTCSRVASMLWIRRPWSIVASTTSSSPPLISQPQAQRFVYCGSSLIVTSSAKVPERLGDVRGEERDPRGRQLGADDRVVLDEPGEVPQTMLDDRARRDVARRGRR